MLQIIGWLLCVYLVVKGFELIAMEKKMAYIGAGIAFVATPIFPVMLNAQSGEMSSPMSALEGLRSSEDAPSVSSDPTADAYEQAAQNLERMADELENSAN